MLFGKSSKLSYSLPVLKHIAEMIVGNHDAIYTALRRESAGTIASTLKSHGIEAKTPIDKLTAYIKLLNPDATFLSWFERQLTLTMMTSNDYNLVYEYSKVPYVAKQLRSKLERDIRNRIGRRADFSDADWSFIMSDFSNNFLEKYSSDFRYDPSSNGIVGYIVNTFGFYMKTKSDMLMGMINTVGVNTDLHNADYSLADYTTVEVESVEDLVGFDKIARDIYNLSNYMFKHNQKVYYDVFSRYKYRLVRQRYEGITRLLSNHFEYTSLYRRPNIVDVNFQVESGQSMHTEGYARKKWKERDNALRWLDPILEDKIGVKELPDVLDQIARYNQQIKNSEQLPFLSKDDYHPKDGLTNETRFKFMIAGMCALRDLVRYINKMGINIFRVKSKIFKDERLLPRYKTFKEYIVLFDAVEDLRKHEREGMRQDLMTNDQVYEDIASLDRISSVKGIPLINIREAIEQYEMKKTIAAKADAKMLIEMPKLAPAELIWRRFKGPVAGNEKWEFPEKFNVVNSIVFPAVVKKLGEVNAITAPDGIRYAVGEAFNLHEFILGNWAEGAAIWDSIRPFVGSSKDNQEQTLTMFRSISFINKFLQYVADTIKWLSERRSMRSDLRLFLDMSSVVGMFTMPARPKHNEEFEWFQDKYNLDYFVPVGKDLQDVNGSLLELYNRMYSEFQIFFQYLNRLYVDVYSPLNDNLRLVEQYPYEVPERLLEEASFSIYRSGATHATELENFKQFKNFCDPNPDRYGFLFKKGRMYKKEHFGGIRYVHEKGYWVWFEGNKFFKIAVSASDRF